MAAGDVFVFDQFFVDILGGLHNLSADDIRVALVTSVVTPAITDVDPRWGAGGSTNYSTNEVTPGGNYSSGGNALTNVTVSLVGGEAIFDADNVTVAQSGSNPTNARWGIIYNNTDTGKRAIGYLDIGTTFDLSSDQFDTQWNSSGVFGINQA